MVTMEDNPDIDTKNILFHQSQNQIYGERLTQAHQEIEVTQDHNPEEEEDFKKTEETKNIITEETTATITIEEIGAIPDLSREIVQRKEKCIKRKRR